MPPTDRLPRKPIGWPLMVSVTTAVKFARLRWARRCSLDAGLLFMAVMLRIRLGYAGGRVG